MMRASFLTTALLWGATALATTPTQVMDRVTTVADSCTSINSAFYTTYVQAYQDDVFLEWQLECKDNANGQDGVAEFEIQVVAGPNSDSAQDIAAFEKYLSEKQRVYLWDVKFTFETATHFTEKLTFESRFTADDIPDVLIHSKTIERTTESYAGYKAHYKDMLQAFWFSGRDQFVSYLGQLWTPTLAAAYRKDVMPKSNIIVTKTALTAYLKNGTSVLLLNPHDVMRDCRVQANGRCA